MRTSLLFCCYCFTVITLLMQTISGHGAMLRPPRGENINNVADALKYLQDLDEFYGDKARPRFGKRRPYLKVLPNSWHDLFSAQSAERTDYSPQFELAY